jgi:hypothetical protein
MLKRQWHPVRWERRAGHTPANIFREDADATARRDPEVRRDGTPEKLEELRASLPMTSATIKDLQKVEDNFVSWQNRCCNLRPSLSSTLFFGRPQRDENGLLYLPESRGT